jgi:hypothetical protein
MQNIYPTRRELQDASTAAALGDTQTTLTTTLLGNMITAAAAGLKVATTPTTGLMGANVHATIALLGVLGYGVTLDNVGTIRVTWG